MQQDVMEMPDILPEFNPLTTIDGSAQQNRWAHDDKLHVKFYTRPVMNPSKSSEAKRAIFDEEDYIIIYTPGSQLTVIDSPIRRTFYEQRFAKRYSEWKAGRTAMDSGTPLEHFPFLFNKVGLTAELKALNIYTVEQLAAIPDISAQRIMGGYDLRAKAAEWITKSKAEGEDAEKALLKEQLATLQAQMAELMKPKAPAPAVKAKE